MTSERELAIFRIIMAFFGLASVAGQVNQKLSELFPSIIKIKDYSKRLHQLDGDNIAADKNISKKVANLLIKQQVPDQAFLQSQNISLNMDADPEAIKKQFVLQMTPKIVSAAKAKSLLSASDFSSSYTQYYDTPVMEAFCTAVVLWSQINFKLAKESLKLKNCILYEGFFKTFIKRAKVLSSQWIIVLNFFGWLALLILGIVSFLKSS